MKKAIIVMFMLLLTGCGAPAVQEQLSPQPSPSAEGEGARRAGEGLPLEKLPSELSIPHFSNMRLSGTGLVLDAVLARTDDYVRHSIHYYSNGLKITGIMNIPTGTGPFPLVIFNHGYIHPSVYTQGRGLKREQDYLAREGFAVLHTDYRGHAGSDESPMVEKTYDGGLEYAMDSANAILAVRAAHLPRIDAERVGMLGHSLGGGVTLAILTGRPDLVDAAVLYAPVHADVWENYMRWRHEREDDDRTMEINRTKEENPKFWENLSPQNFLSRIKPSILLFHGTKDKDVPHDWSKNLSTRLKESGKDITFVEYEGEGHEFGVMWQDFMRKTAEFFRKKLYDS